MKRILVLNGPNLNLLGKRETTIYGNDSLAEIENYVRAEIQRLGFEVELKWVQKNAESDLIEEIQNCNKDHFSGIIINPAAYSHTSVAIMDAMRYTPVNIVEVHLSNTHSREGFRKKRMTAQASLGIVEGFGKDSYVLAVLSIIRTR